MTVLEEQKGKSRAVDRTLAKLIVVVELCGM